MIDVTIKDSKLLGVGLLYFNEPKISDKEAL